MIFHNDIYLYEARCFACIQFWYNTPPDKTYNTPARYTINLLMYESLPSQTTYCKEIVVVGPLSDGINDLFTIKSTVSEKYNIRIYNRRGSVMFVSGNITKRWNDMYKGVLQPVVYILASLPILFR